MNQKEFNELKYFVLKNQSDLINSLNCLMSVLSFEDNDLKDNKKIVKFMSKAGGLILKVNVDLINQLENIDKDITKIIEK